MVILHKASKADKADKADKAGRLDQAVGLGFGWTIARVYRLRLSKFLEVRLQLAVSIKEPRAHCPFGNS